MELLRQNGQAEANSCAIVRRANPESVAEQEHCLVLVLDSWYICVVVLDDHTHNCVVSEQGRRRPSPCRCLLYVSTMPMVLRQQAYHLNENVLTGLCSRCAALVIRLLGVMRSAKPSARRGDARIADMCGYVWLDTWQFPASLSHVLSQRRSKPRANRNIMKSRRITPWLGTPQTADIPWPHLHSKTFEDLAMRHQSEALRRCFDHSRSLSTPAIGRVLRKFGTARRLQALM